MLAATLALSQVSLVEAQSISTWWPQGTHIDVRHAPIDPLWYGTFRSVDSATRGAQIRDQNAPFRPESTVISGHSAWAVVRRGRRTDGRIIECALCAVVVSRTAGSERLSSSRYTVVTIGRGVVLG